MASLLDALLGACDADAGAWVLGAWNSNLGGGLQLQLLQLLTVLTDDKSMVLLRNGDRSRCLKEKRNALSKNNNKMLELYHAIIIVQKNGHFFIFTFWLILLGVATVNHPPTSNPMH